MLVRALTLVRCDAAADSARTCAARHNGARAIRFLDHRTLAGVGRTKMDGRRLRRARAGTRRHTYEPAVAVIERSAEPLRFEHLAALLDDQPRPSTTCWPGWRRRSLLPRWVTSHGALVAGPVRYRHGEGVEVEGRAWQTPPRDEWASAGRGRAGVHPLLADRRGRRGLGGVGRPLHRRRGLHGAHVRDDARPGVDQEVDRPGDGPVLRDLHGVRVARDRGRSGGVPDAEPARQPRPVQAADRLSRDLDPRVRAATASGASRRTTGRCGLQATPPPSTKRRARPTTPTTRSA